MNNRKIEPEERSDKQKALEIMPAIVAGILLLLGMYFKDPTLKVVFCSLAAAIGIGAYLVVLIIEIINRRKKKNGKK